MITNALLKIIFGTILLILLPIRALPDATIPQGISDAISAISGYLTPVDVVIPISAVLGVLTSFLVIEAGIFTYKALAWAYKKIPGVN